MLSAPLTPTNSSCLSCALLTTQGIRTQCSAGFLRHVDSPSCEQSNTKNKVRRRVWVDGESNHDVLREVSLRSPAVYSSGIGPTRGTTASNSSHSVLGQDIGDRLVGFAAHGPGDVVLKRLFVLVQCLLIIVSNKNDERV